MTPQYAKLYSPDSPETGGLATSSLQFEEELEKVLPAISRRASKPRYIEINEAIRGVSLEDYVKEADRIHATISDENHEVAAAYADKFFQVLTEPVPLTKHEQARVDWSFTEYQKLYELGIRGDGLISALEMLSQVLTFSAKRDLKRRAIELEIRLSSGKKCRVDALKNKSR